ncbi:glyoxalase [Duganella sp. FT109W]|uniref:Glyoxalase n=1 Tax=Duganella margarita TaxID=2692170 RepID=A0ABW9WDV3_9BURK|nr:VOC family protein [Duganella margarita]MYN38480.1 glyoxalase [Duganella margarita]
MSSIPKQTLCGVIPCLRYRDAPAAIDWLCSTFGFEVQFVVPNEDGSIAHAQLTFGNSMVMLGSVFDTEYGRLLKQPMETGGFVTQSAYLVVNSADEVYGRVLQAGGQIVLDLKDEDYGGRGFTCRDPEGHIWSIGTYDPYAQAGV